MGEKRALIRSNVAMGMGSEIGKNLLGASLRSAVVAQVSPGEKGVRGARAKIAQILAFFGAGSRGGLRPPRATDSRFPFWISRSLRRIQITAICGWVA